MKRFLFLIVGSILAAAVTAKADEGKSVRFITTKSGKTYQNCRIFKQDPDGVMFAHQNGAAKILFADMSESMRNSLGYDATKASAYAKSTAEKYQKERERQFEYRKLVVKAQTAAAELEMKRIEAYGYPYAGDGGYYNSGTLDYTTISPYGYYGNGFGYSNGYGQGGRFQKSYGYRGTRGVFQNGPLCNSTNGNSISRSAHGYLPRVNAAKPALGVPALNSLAPALGPAR